MKKYQAFIEAWGVAHWEFTLAFEDLADEDLWRRPHPSLLSVGELAAHVAYSESQLPQPITQSPLVDKRSRYYLHQIDDPLVLELTVAQVLEELKSVHEAAVAAASQVQNVDEAVHWRDDWTWYECVKYMGCFHVAYHTGQAFSARHLMGHKTNDN
ncbi:MAG: DUF664 domain-containing protein [Armatimonadota bacterium]|nr:DUF664 domain-containing protein [Armatimonadota bacterium]